MLNSYAIFISKVCCRQLLIPFVILECKFWLCNKTLEKQSYFCLFPRIDFPNNIKNNISAIGFIKCVQSIETLIPICMLKITTFFFFFFFADGVNRYSTLMIDNDVLGVICY